LLLRKLIFVFAIAAFLPLSAQADSLMPELPKAKENYNDKTKCVESVDVMRKSHMDFIMHQRDETSRKGIRTKQHSLKECIDCHNAPGKDAKVASANDNDHFCSSCHVYTAVQIDCFKCHADKPANTEYRHKITSQAFKQHKFATQDLNQKTLQLLATEKEGRK